MQAARAWLEKRGFDVTKANLDAGTGGKTVLRLQFDRTEHERRCDSLAYSMALDRKFWDGQDDPGYGKWD